jgi:hypothetical protein
VPRDVEFGASPSLRLDVMLHLSLSADVTVARSRTFGNLADVPDPAQNLLGIAESASRAPSRPGSCRHAR